MKSLERLAYEIGKDYGVADSKVQADLLNGFFAGFLWNQDAVATGNQAFYISQDLTPSAKTGLKILSESANYDC